MGESPGEGSSFFALLCSSLQCSLFFGKHPYQLYPYLQVLSYSIVPSTVHTMIVTFQFSLIDFILPFLNLSYLILPHLTLTFRLQDLVVFPLIVPAPLSFSLLFTSLIFSPFFSPHLFSLLLFFSPHIFSLLLYFSSCLLLSSSLICSPLPFSSSLSLATIAHTIKVLQSI